MTTVVTSDFSPTWVVSVDAPSGATAWTLRLTGGDATWAPLGGLTVSAYLVNSWDVLNTMSGDFSPRWNVSEVASISGGGELPDPVTGDFAASWSITGVVTSDFAPAWRVIGTVTSDFAAAWDSITAVQSDFVSGWNVGGLPGFVERSLLASWNVRNEVQADFSPAWAVISPVISNFPVQWNVLSEEVPSGIRVPALRFAAESPKTRTIRVRMVVDSGSPIGLVVGATSSDEEVVTVTESAAADADGYATFELQFRGIGRSAITFTEDVSGKSAQMLAIGRL